MIVMQYPFSIPSRYLPGVRLVRLVRSAADNAPAAVHPEQRRLQPITKRTPSVYSLLLVTSRKIHSTSTTLVRSVYPTFDGTATLGLIIAVALW